MAGSYPDESMYLLQHLFNNWFTNLDFDKMAAAALSLVFYTVRGDTASAEAVGRRRVKGI